MQSLLTAISSRPVEPTKSRASALRLDFKSSQILTIFKFQAQNLTFLILIGII